MKSKVFSIILSVCVMCFFTSCSLESAKNASNDKNTTIAPTMWLFLSLSGVVEHIWRIRIS